MEFRVLGPLAVLDGDRVVALGGVRQRSLLALLLLRANEPISTDRLVDELWGERPPGTAQKTVQVYVSQLRKLLGEGRIETHGHGYALRIAADELDLDRFHALVERARHELPGAAAATLRHALDHFRGEPLQDLVYEPWAQNEVARIREIRLEALEQRVDADLALGRHRSLVSELEALVREHPTREGLRGKLMVALYRSGRQADALEAYRQGRSVLDAELGLEPGPELRELEQRILRQDPALAATAVPAESGVRPEGDHAVRTFLIADIRGYTHYTQTHGDEAAGELASRFAALTRESVGSFGGDVVELRGDEALCVFGSARQAIRAAVDLQSRCRGGDDEALALPIGIGLEAGEAVQVEGGYRGGALNTAARLCAQATDGQILASETILTLAGKLEGIQLSPRRPVRLKGLERPVPVIDVAPDGGFAPLPPAVPARTHRGRGAALVAAGVALLAAAGVAVAVVELTGGGLKATGLATVAPDGVGIVDTGTGRIVGRVPIPGGPSLAAAGENVVWVASDASRTVSSIDVVKRAVTHVVAPNVTPAALAADGDALWILDGNRRRLVEIDATYGQPVKHIDLPRAPPRQASNERLSSFSVAYADGSLWVTDGSSRLLRVDPISRQVSSLDVREPLDDVAVGAGAVWATSGPGASVYQIDLQGRTVKTRIRIVNRLGTAAPFPVAVAVGEGAVWVLNGNTQTVTRIDPDLGGVSATIPLGIGANPNDIASGGGAIWVANGGNGTLDRIDPGTNAATPIPIGSNPAGLAVGKDGVWVAVQPGFRTAVTVARGPAPVSAGGATPLPASICSPIEYEGKGAPRFLIVSDLPLQGVASLAETIQQSDAVRFVLAQRRFHVGRYSVGYQLCDDSISQTGEYDPRRCRTNASAFAADTSVIGIVGAYNSGCAKEQLAILDRAEDGPLPIVSNNATYVGLTHAGPGTATGEPQVYYPRGVRNFVRVVAADDVQGAADSVLAKQLGVRRLYVLHDLDVYGLGIASSVRRAAVKLGVGVVGFGPWDPHARSYVALARVIRRTRADGVFLGGSIDISNGAVLVKDLRAVLGAQVHILTPDGFTPITAFARLAGPAAEGVTVSFPATPPEQLHGRGKQFVADFAQALGRPVEAYSVASAESTEVLLDAIARSDGTRASVTAELFRTKVSNGILGSFSINRNGDTSAGAVTIYRIVAGKPVVFKVIVPPPSLVGQ